MWRFLWDENDDDDEIPEESRSEMPVALPLDECEEGHWKSSVVLLKWMGGCEEWNDAPLNGPD